MKSAEPQERKTHMKGIDTCELTEQATQLGSRVSDMAKDVRERADAAQQDIRRNLKRVKSRADDMLEEGRHEIKSHPLTAVAAFTAVGLLLGFTAGMLLSARKRS
jgi:ElaB/YqjD/DUF883 family membrane-anchored ribosome-binding protein